MSEEPIFPKWNSEPYESMYKKRLEEKTFVLKESQVKNIIEVLEHWKNVIESFIQEYYLLMERGQ